jgi:hypothetical protein
MKNVEIVKIRGLIWNFPGWTEENHKNVGQYGRCLRVVLNPVPPKHEVGWVTTILRRWVNLVATVNFV